MTSLGFEGNEEGIRYFIQFACDIAFYIVSLIAVYYYLNELSYLFGGVWFSLNCGGRTLVMALCFAMAIFGGDWLIRLLFFETDILLKLPDTVVPVDWRLGFVMSLVVYSLASISEEFVFRGVLYPALRERFSILSGALFSALVFAAMHFLNFYQLSPTAALRVFCYQFVLGIAAVVLLEYTKSLSGPIIMHLANNAYALVVQFCLDVIPFQEVTNK